MAFELKKVRVPTARDRVNKEDCAFCFKNVETEGGLFVDLNSFIGVCGDHLALHHERTSNTVYLHIVRTRTLKPVEKEGDGQKRKAVVLGIGVEGGFDPEEEKRWEVKDAYQLYNLVDKSFHAYPDASLPWLVSQAAEAVVKADTASKKDEVKAVELTDKPQPSKHTKDLKQLDNGVKIPRHGWKCTHCDLTENLWMNLTDGTILCGRRNFDGSGGNNHAVEHYQRTGFPLAVKLGTITAAGTADVYSYPEDIMVDDPHLRAHLAHFGINALEMEKTDKTLAEMEVDLNNNYEWSRMNEAGKKLTPLFGPGYTGMRNIGNSCYLASVSQVLLSLPAFQRRYVGDAAAIFRHAPADPTRDFSTQMAKLAEGLASGRFSVPSKAAREGEAAYQEGVAPKMFKGVVGAGHAEFATNRQQDALEFFQHLLTLVERAERGSPADPSRVFRLRVEERLECTASHKVRYGSRLDNSLSLPIPTDRAANAAEYAAYEAELKAKRARGEKLDPRAPAVRPLVTLQACLEAWAAPEVVHGFYSPAAKSRVDALKRSRLASFPDVLCIHMRKFVLDGWVPRKLDALVDAPDELDLSAFRAHGLQPGEELLPEEKAGGGVAAAAAAPKTANEAVVGMVVEMGFPRNRAERAVMATNNAGVEEAMNWLMEHMDDPDIDAPVAAPVAAPAAPAAEALNEEGIAMLMSMGFTREQAAKALRATGNNVERATDWIFSHADELNAMDTTPVSAAAPSGAAAAPAASDVSDGAGRYRLAAFVSHMGSNTSSGHYVCHIRKDGRWVAFDDQKVGASELLPKDLAYLYFYTRV